MNNSCPHFPKCSGCTQSDIFNPPIWQEAIRFFNSLNIEPQLVVDGFAQTRYKAKLAVRPKSAIGLFKKNTHEVIPIPHCQVHHPAINQAVEIIKNEMLLQNLPAYDEQTQKGSLRYLQFFVQKETGQVQLTLVTTQDIKPFCNQLIKKNSWHSIWQNIHPASNNRVLGDAFELIHGKPYLTQTLCHTPIAFHPGAFSQAHLPLFEKMIEKIITWTHPADRVLELYAGVGAIGLNLPCKHLTLIENNPYAQLSYNQNPKPHITYRCIDSAQAELEGYDLIIVDPPRKGLDSTLLPKLNAPRLVYVSCGFDSFQRDCQVLISLGWQIKEALGYLFFAGTNHVETLAYFER